MYHLMEEDELASMDYDPYDLEVNYTHLISDKSDVVKDALGYWNEFLSNPDSRPWIAPKGKTSRIWFLRQILGYVFDIIWFRFYENHSHYMQFDRRDFGILNSWKD